MSTITDDIIKTYFNQKNVISLLSSRSSKIQSLFLLPNMFRHQIVAFHDQSESNPEGSKQDSAVQSWSSSGFDL